MELIKKYFRDLTEDQIIKLSKLKSIYEGWNSKINVISRKDFENFYERHVLHSLSISLNFQFVKGEKIIDVGTGGGFPGIPLAIKFPDCEFCLIDSIGKKIKVVEAVINELGLNNAKALKVRSNELKGNYNYIISRAVTTLPEFINDTEHLISDQKKINKGIICLKGGDLTEETKLLKQYKIIDLNQNISEDFFQTKKIVFIPY